MSPRPKRLTPGEYAASFPGEPIDDPAAEAARQLVLNLISAIGERSLREAGVATGVDRTTIAEVIAGRSWPDIATLARLEVGLGVGLWPPFSDSART
jgi:hypothetical protein